MKLAGYIYSRRKSKSLSLEQGDIIRLDESLKEKIKEYFPLPESTHKNENSYILVLTQTCDLIRRRKCVKAEHIKFCLIRPFSAYLEKKLENYFNKKIANIHLGTELQFSYFVEEIMKLLNNSGDIKTYFFLPKKSPFEEHMVAILSVSYPLRIDSYDKLLKNRILSLKPEFQAKLGWFLAQLYGRIAASDLTEYKSSRNLMATIRKEIEKNFNGNYIIDLPDDRYINKLVDKSIKSTEIKIAEKIKEHIRKISAELESKDLKPVRDHLRKKARLLVRELLVSFSIQETEMKKLIRKFTDDLFK